MKTAFNIALLFLLSGLIPAFSQGNNLQFNRVVYYELQLNDTTGTNPYTIADSVVITVPANKVLKVESIFGNTSGIKVRLNETWISYAYSQFPIWLPEGSHVFKIEDDCNCGGCSTCTYNGAGTKSALSGIEFNIIP